MNDQTNAAPEVQYVPGTPVQIPVQMMNFMNKDGFLVGQLQITGAEVKFTGATDASAQMFFQSLIKTFESHFNNVHNAIHNHYVQQNGITAPADNIVMQDQPAANQGQTAPAPAAAPAQAAPAAPATTPAAAPAAAVPAANGKPVRRTSAKK